MIIPRAAAHSPQQRGASSSRLGSPSSSRGAAVSARAPTLVLLLLFFPRATLRHSSPASSIAYGLVLSGREKAGALPRRQRKPSNPTET